MAVGITVLVFGHRHSPSEARDLSPDRQPCAAAGLQVSVLLAGDDDRQFWLGPVLKDLSIDVDRIEFRQTVSKLRLDRIVRQMI